MLLRLYPRNFRQQFGEDLLLIFRDAWSRAGSGVPGTGARVALVLDLLGGAATEQLDRFRRHRSVVLPPVSRPSSPLTMRDLFAEFRQAVRSLSRTPGFSFAVVLTLALGIGANTAIFSVVDGVLLRPAPFEAMDRLTMVWGTDRTGGSLREPASGPDYLDFQERSKRFERLAAFSPITSTLTPDTGDPTVVPALWVSHEFLPMVGVRPLLGNIFDADQDRPGAPPVALISEALWTERFARDRSVVGRALRIGDTPFTIVGVLPASADFGTLQILGLAAYRRGFADRSGPRRVDVWTPLQASREGNRDNRRIFMMGRLLPGTSVAQAQEEMSGISADLGRLYPESNEGRSVHVEPLPAVVFGGVKPALMVLLGAVALVLLVACANVANLLLARGAGRAREVTVRAALGASVGRLTRQFLIESAVLTGAGALLGVLLALGGLELLLALAPATIPRVGAVGIDARVLMVTLTLAVVVGVAFGLVPAVQARRRGSSLGREGGGRGVSSGKEHRRFRSGLVIAELALAVVLMVGAGLMIKSLWRLYQVDPGFRAQGVLKAEFQLPASYPQRLSDWPGWLEIRRFNDEVRRRVAALPGVVGVTIAGVHPLQAGYTIPIEVVGREGEAANWPEPSLRLVDSAYQATMRMPLIAGRPLDDDAAAAPVLGINQAARRRFFGSRNPLGHRVRLWERERTIVAVFADERFHGLAEAATPAIYVPTSQAPVPDGSILVRVTGDPAEFAGTLRGVVRGVDPTVPLSGIEPLDQTLTQTTAQRRFTMLLLGVFAAVALVLA
ncbi:MAG TPA: ADOP family duplicated permease, partial [Gemmatimonadales bacterium]|nr:ADOP family duplicated permease [Gemmatimonadales bacterium]